MRARIILTEATVQELINQYQEKIPIETLNKIIEADPTRKNKIAGKYTKWLINLFLKKKLKEEDLYKATEYLQIYSKSLSHFPIASRNIFNVADLSDLLSIIEPIRGFKTKGQKHQDRKGVSSEKDFKLVYQDESWLVYQILTKAGAQNLGGPNPNIPKWSEN
jgi:hypothetical protein